ncbi:signal recognition particle-docking protein FtsY [Candidatus Xianfuyuplasma coldseepsis]|uniref:Signal recognition particle receptor FtsY n=1 Tax=Candidatus Xianfuyuplasma coldseepsis TaxID=2782163 RepID=A0A7L7KRP3_9MOLU|nr:signal recognition particle-docking protein FtsY [Xianfuyuplasma coldseepsis]QMS85403.1 signal recognition particle-docking protein FtsY [Xianfuyuplasma coldseepsis]
MGFFKNLFQSKSKKEQAEKYRIGMAKTRRGVLAHLQELLDNRSDISDDLFDELEEIFIMADIGVNTVVKIVSHLRKEVDTRGVTDVEEVKELLIDQLFRLYVKDSIVSSNLDIQQNRVNVVLFVGVNGVGKTTTIAKVAYEYIKKGKQVLMVAGDTFRAGAINQLKIWAERVGADFYAKEEGSDPSSVMFDAIEHAKKNEIDVILCDTAGRLQNKTNLMKELEKINKVIGREIDGAPHETLLVIDATTGQNGLSQAKIFNEVTTITGIVLTKLDGTAKGGIVLAIRDEMDIPIKYVGLGETLDDLEHFDIEEYIYGMFEGIF